MAGKIYGTVIKNNTYYYFKESYRKKIDSQKLGKTKGSGKSKVKTRSEYLGTAEEILALKKSSKGPVSVFCRSFGMVAAAYQTAKEFGLVDILKKHIPGSRYGIPRWMFFLVTILNRLDQPTSKNKIANWAKKTVLEDILDVDLSKLTSKHFWYVTDDVISEGQLKEKRKKATSDTDDIFCDLDDGIFQKIETELFQRIFPMMDSSAEALVYDTTNFFTFFESEDNSFLAQTGHNKEGRHNLRQVGLALAVEKSSNLPFFHRVYRGNSHDSQTFATVVDDFLKQTKNTFKNIDELVLILDKGNNKDETFDFLHKKIEWVGSLVPTHHNDLLAIPLEQYATPRDGVRALRVEKKVMNHDCVLVMTYNEKLDRKQRASFHKGINKLKEKLTQKLDSYKKKPKTFVQGLRHIVTQSKYKDYVVASLNQNGEIVLNLQEDAFKDYEKRFGKNLLFTSKENPETSWVIRQYNEKDVIEKSFETLKDVDLIRIRPLRHWTDTKIRAYIFCCIQSLLLLRLMKHKIDEADVSMSESVLKEELSDLKEVIMIYDNDRAERKITDASSIQKKLSCIFRLEEISKQVTLHNDV